MGKSKIDERGRITLPLKLREALGLRPGQEVRIERNESGILLRHAITKEKFLEELEGCITEANQAEKISPLKLKEIWGAGHAHH